MKTYNNNFLDGLEIKINKVLLYLIEEKKNHTHTTRWTTGVLNPIEWRYPRMKINSIRSALKIMYFNRLLLVFFLERVLSTLPDREVLLNTIRHF